VQGFFAQHWEVAGVIFNLLIAVVVTLGVALVRVQLKHIDTHQHRQDFRLSELEGDVGSLKGNGVRTDEQIANLSRTLEHYFIELGKDMEQYQARNEESHKELKSLLQARKAEG